MWTQVEIDGYEAYLKYFEEPSKHGIEGGRISKMNIRKDGVELYNYDRGLDFDSLDAAGRMVYEYLINRYN